MHGFMGNWAWPLAGLFGEYCLIVHLLLGGN